jgi:hypothetical protein
MSGVTNDEIEPRLIDAGIGLMTSQNIAYSPERVARFPHVGLDNGCFTAGDKWDETKWINYLARQTRANVRFAVSPDVYCDSVASLERGMEYAPILADMGLPVGLVAQGTDPNLAYPWSEFHCLFLGGRQLKDPRAEWKESQACAKLVAEARRHGLWVHMGRVNDQYRYAHAERIGCHSADGSMLAFGPDANIGRVVRMVRRRDTAPPLPFKRFESPSHPAHKEALREGAPE